VADPGDRAGQLPLRAILEKRRRPLVTVAPDESVRSAIARMVASDVGVVVVPHGGPTPSWGVLSERDIVRNVVAPGLDPRTTAVADAMRRIAPRVHPDATVQSAMHYLTQIGRRHALVAVKGHLVGVVSLGDLAACVTEELERDVRDLVDYIAKPREPHDG